MARLQVLVVSPQPFYIERGTPIAVNLLCKALTERGYEVDLLAYDIGEDREYPNFSIHRARTWPRINTVKPGFSFKKIYFDIFLLFKMFSLLRRKRYSVIHAVEESAFIAMLMGFLFRIPYIYDKDSNMATQMIHQHRRLKPFKRLLYWLESLPARGAAAVVPVCDALADEVRSYRQDNIYTLKDISMAPSAGGGPVADNISNTCAIGGNNILMYIGNLEKYQGIELMLQGFALYAKSKDSVALVIIGGDNDDISNYREMSENLGIGQQTFFLGKRPLAQIDGFMRQADVLISPRTSGVNTPMKIYSYLDSGVAVLATDLATHNQVMSSDIACLVEANPEAFARGIEKLLCSSDYRRDLAQAARKIIDREHNYTSYCNVLYGMYDDLAAKPLISK